MIDQLALIKFKDKLIEKYPNNKNLIIKEIDSILLLLNDTNLSQVETHEKLLTMYDKLDELQESLDK